MKKAMVMVAAGLFLQVAAHAATSVGQCVYPKTKVTQSGRLELKNPVLVFSAPDASATGQPLSSLTSFTVKAEKAGYIQLVTVPDYTQPDPDKNAGKVVGWAKRSDFQLQDRRNCTD